jgi:SAM-dependent methyltransferase
MERLDINSAPERANIEASIHFARYSVVTPFVKNKRVLDIASGEGYGSYLLKQSGASEVVGVDVFEDAVNRSNLSFGGPGIKFIAADATKIESQFPENYFDVVVSLETIEHIKDPIAYLQSLKRVAKEDATIIISCPNDHWYFPEDYQRNPYHLRKYRFEEFKELACGVFGDNVNWSIGTAVMGFGSTSLDIERDYNTIPDSWMKFNNVQGAYLVNGGEKPEFNAENCSYFFGIWNAPEVTNGAAIFPVSMDAYARMIPAMEGTLSVEERLKLNELESTLKQFTSDLRKTRLNYQATLSENELVKERILALQAELQSVHDDKMSITAERDNMRIGYHRYVLLGNLVPKPLRTLLKRAYKMVRGNSI